MPRRNGYRAAGGLRGGIAGGLAGLATGMDELIADRTLQKRAQRQALFQDILLRSRQAETDRRELQQAKDKELRAESQKRRDSLYKGEIDLPQYEAGERGDVAGMQPSVSAVTSKILGDPKSPTDVKSIEEFNLQRPSERMAPIQRPDVTEPGGIDVFKGPGAIPSLLDPNTSEASGALKAQRRKFQSAVTPTTRTIYDPVLNAKTEQREQFDPFEGTMRPMGKPQQIEATPEQEGARKAAVENIERPGKVQTAGAVAGATTRAQQQAEIAASGLTTQQQQAANQYRESFQQEARPFYVGESAFRKALALGPTPQGDIALVFSYMTMLDPNSSVREGEQAQVRDANSLIGRAQLAYNKALTGEGLLDSTRKDILTQSRNLYTAVAKEHQQRVQRYSQMAATSHIPPALVVRPAAEDLVNSGPRVLSTDPNWGAGAGIGAGAR